MNQLGETWIATEKLAEEVVFPNKKNTPEAMTRDTLLSTNNEPLKDSLQTIPENIKVKSFPKSFSIAFNTYLLENLN